MHGNLGPVHRLVEEHSPDILLCCGDWGDPGGVAEAEYRELVSKVHVLSVFGNHDDLALLASLNNTDGTPVVLANGRLRDVKGARIAGINGIWAKSHRNPWYITDEEIVAA